MAYIKQNWVNGETICNAERINHIEDGIANSLTPENIKTTQTNSDTDTYSCNYIESLKGEVIYNGAGVDGDITLNKSAKDYKYIEVFYTSDGVYSSTKFEYGDNRKFSCNNIYVINENQYQLIYTSSYSILDNKITHLYTTNNFITRDNSIGSFGASPFILIYKVIGYK